MNNKKVGISIGVVLLAIAAVGAIFYFLTKDDKEIIYKVSFDNDGVVNVVEVKENENVERPIEPVKEGYTFEGWYYNGTKFDFTTKITKDITLEARWLETAAKKWKITFDTDGGESIEPLNVVDGEVIDKVPTPVKKGYTFEGWFYNGAKFDFDNKITKDMTLVARWEKEKTETTTKVTKYTVTFNTNGGSAVDKKTVEKDKTVSKPNDPTREGFEFIGWFDGDVEFDFKTKITKNITLTAKWKELPKTYTVTFDADNGSDSSSLTVEEGKTVSKPADPTKEGHTFIGWYYNNAEYNFSTAVMENITLVANWERIPVVSYKMEKIEESYVKQVRIYVLLDNVAVDGFVDITTTNGKVKTVEISKDGYITNGEIIEKIDNARVK